MTFPKLKLAILTSHPIQYQAPLFRELARHCELTVFFAHRQTPQAQADAGFGVAFEWDVDLLAGYPHRFLQNVSKRPDTGRFFGCDTPAVIDEIASERFDAFVVMGWHLKCFWQAVYACRKVGTPVMVRGDSQLATSRGWLKRFVKALVYPWILSRFDACLYVGQRNRDYLAHYGVHAENLFFSPHCVDVEAFAQRAADSDPTALRREWGLAGDDQCVLFAGKLGVHKRPQDLIASVGLLRQQGRRVLVVWAGDGPERESLEALGRSNQVPMVFLGFCNQSRLPAVYGAADVLALPSPSETWGLVVNEAMACGTPCVVSNACGCAPDMVDSGLTGQTFAAGDIAALARALAAVLAGNTSQAALIQKTALHSPGAAAMGIVEAAKALAIRKGSGKIPPPRKSL